MSKLKELTWEVHQQAERTSFARKLLKGLSPEEYYKYIYNQYQIYSVLEHHVVAWFPELKSILRAEKILADLKELEKLHNIDPTVSRMCPVVPRYEKHISTLSSDGIIAHLYVRHFGDMYGGQMIKKRNPGSGKMYQFENVEELKTLVRAKLKDSMAEEANRCFEFAIELFRELDNE
jgi:heme oxygenase (biliverdin-producing, ferredoxin)